MSRRPEDVKVSLVTPTIRRGFWNVMAHNIAAQTHPHLEWLIIDDHPADRSQIARHHARARGLEIRYLRGKPRRVERRYALVSANNTALAEARGELWIWLQDFILMPPDGVERAVALYLEHETALQALLDRYYRPAIPPDTESEDWFHGELDVLGELLRVSPRFSDRSHYTTEDPFVFEANYGAIPAAVARDLNGWWEFMDDGMGYDNTEIALRALLRGYGIVVDETNVCSCIDHWQALEGTWENIEGREHNSNLPRYVFFERMTRAGRLPLVRDAAIDESLVLEYTLPPELSPDDALRRLVEIQGELVEGWLAEHAARLPAVSHLEDERYPDLSREDGRRRLSFVWDFGVGPAEVHAWEDGLRAALDVLSGTHGWIVDAIASEDTGTILRRVEAHNPHAILCWGSLDRPSFAHLRDFHVPLALCFAGGPTEHPHLRSFDLVFVENEIYAAAFREQGVRVARAFGTHEALFRPLPLAPRWEAIYPATFCGYKRHDLFARAAGAGGLAVGGISRAESWCHEVCIEEGSTVLPRVPYRVLPHLYNQSRTALVTARLGSQRTVLEAMACDVWPIVMRDNPWCCEFVEESGYGSIVEPEVEAIRAELARLRDVAPCPGGRDFILRRYRAEHYAGALARGLDALGQETAGRWWLDDG